VRFQLGENVLNREARNASIGNAVRFPTVDCALIDPEMQAERGLTLFSIFADLFDFCSGHGRNYARCITKGNA
jgi:hypothetical protein